MRKVYVMDELIRLPPVTTDGRIGLQLLAGLRKAGFCIGTYAAERLRRKWSPITNGAVYEPVIIRGDKFTTRERCLSKIKTEAKRLSLVIPPIELAPYLRENVTQHQIEKMGLSTLVIMHERFMNSGGNLSMLCLFRDWHGDWLGSFRCSPMLYGNHLGLVFLSWIPNSYPAL